MVQLECAKVPTPVRKYGCVMWINSTKSQLSTVWIAAGTGSSEDSIRPGVRRSRAFLFLHLCLLGNILSTSMFTAKTAGALLRLASAGMCCFFLRISCYQLTIMCVCVDVDWLLCTYDCMNCERFVSKCQWRFSSIMSDQFVMPPAWHYWYYRQVRE